MAHFAAAFAFSERPDWTRLDGVAPSLDLRGFRLRDQPIWLLACRRAEHADGPFPFKPFLLEPDVTEDSPESPALAAALALAASMVSDERCGQAVLHSALVIGESVQRALGLPTLFFAADDEGLNLAFLADDGGVAACLVEGHDGNVRLQDGRVIVEPIAIEGEEDDSPAPHFAEDLEGQPLIDVQPLRVIDEDDAGRSMFSAPRRLWPAAWPDPAEHLGLGTFDAFANFPADFDAEYVRPAA